MAASGAGNDAPYDEDYYRRVHTGAARSAAIVVPLVLEHVPARAVVDLGCGIGTWLSVFRRHGVAEAVGIDGDWVDRAMLQIPAGDFLPRDLAAPLDIGRSFDLAISLEVAEHLPESSAPQFVESLTRLAPVVLFSAAIPLQGGVSHLNEQWQGYWAELFRARDYIAIDCVRPPIWNDERVKVIYRQNTLIYCRLSALANYPKLAAAGPATYLSIAHPKLYQKRARPDSI